MILGFEAAGKERGREEKEGKKKKRRVVVVRRRRYSRRVSWRHVYKWEMRDEPGCMHSLYYGIIAICLLNMVSISSQPKKKTWSLFLSVVYSSLGLDVNGSQSQLSGPNHITGTRTCTHFPCKKDELTTGFFYLVETFRRLDVACSIMNEQVQKGKGSTVSYLDESGATLILPNRKNRGSGSV